MKCGLSFERGRSGSATAVARKEQGGFRRRAKRVDQIGERTRLGKTSKGTTPAWGLVGWGGRGGEGAAGIRRSEGPT